jgi:hypothetical protein
MTRMSPVTLTSHLCYGLVTGSLTVRQPLNDRKQAAFAADCLTLPRVALTPMFIFGIADGIGWFLRCMLWQRSEIASQSEGNQARDETVCEAPLTLAGGPGSRSRRVR